MPIALLAPAEEPVTAVMLPTPSNISRGVNISVDKKLSRSGKVYTYVKDAKRQSLLLEFTDVMHAKMYELEKFFTMYAGRRVMIMMHDGSTWEAAFENPNLPLSYKGNQHFAAPDIASMEFGSFTLSFVEGVKVNA